MRQVETRKCDHRECGSNVNGWCQVEGLRPTLCQQAVEELAQDNLGKIVKIRKVLLRNLTPGNKVNAIYAIVFPNAALTGAEGVPCSGLVGVCHAIKQH